MAKAFCAHDRANRSINQGGIASGRVGIARKNSGRVVLSNKNWVSGYPPQVRPLSYSKGSFPDWAGSICLKPDYSFCPVFLIIWYPNWVFTTGLMLP
jgi:hypothetical protein